MAASSGVPTEQEPFDYQEYDKDSELTLFLEKEDLTSLQMGLSALNINFQYIKYVQTEQLNVLCDKLKLKIGSSTRLQFTRAVIKLQAELKQQQQVQQTTHVVCVDEKEQHEQKKQHQHHTPHSMRNLLFFKDAQPETESKEDSKPATKNGRLSHHQMSSKPLQQPNNNRGYDYLIKCILLGDSGVGKSCILLRYVDDTFRESRIFTVGIDYRMKTVELGDDVIKYQIWDTAGQEKYRTIVNAYYRAIDCALLCYDVTNRESFENIANWIENVQQHTQGSDAVFMMLVGTKIDLLQEHKHESDADAVEEEVVEREVSVEEGEQLAREYGIKFCEVSAKSGHGIESLFLTTAACVINLKKEQIQKIKKTRARTQEKLDLIEAEAEKKAAKKKDADDDGLERVNTDRFVKKKCCNVYI